MERKDTCSPENDNLLSEVVFSHLRNGSTQLKAFEEAAEKLGRTSKACGFRWNSTIRKLHEDALAELKGVKKGRHRMKPEVVRLHSVHTEDGKKTLAVVFSYIKELEQTVAKQQKEIEQLQKQINSNHERYIANDDLQTLMKIISNARRNGYLNQAN